MASGSHKNHALSCMFFLVAFSQALSIRFVGAANKWGLLGREAAIVYEQADITRGNSFHGAHGVFNIWNPNVTGAGEFSSAKIRLSASPGEFTKTIEAGWRVLPGDKKPQFFVYWTKDNYGQTGCYNLECPGFVQTSKIFKFGSPLSVSKYGGIQYETQITILKDKDGDWAVRKDGSDVGYWPADIFTDENFQEAMYISWGGEVFNSGLSTGGKHTSTQMGSGHFPGEGNRKAAFITHLGVIVADADAPRDPQVLARFATKGSCYDVQIAKDEGFGTQIYYGGPGNSAQCP